MAAVHRPSTLGLPANASQDYGRRSLFDDWVRQASNFPVADQQGIDSQQSKTQPRQPALDESNSYREWMHSQGSTKWQSFSSNGGVRANLKRKRSRSVGGRHRVHFEDNYENLGVYAPYSRRRRLCSVPRFPPPKVIDPWSLHSARNGRQSQDIEHAQEVIGQPGDRFECRGNDHSPFHLDRDIAPHSSFPHQTHDPPGFPHQMTYLDHDVKYDCEADNTRPAPRSGFTATYVSSNWPNGRASGSHPVTYSQTYTTHPSSQCPYHHRHPQWNYSSLPPGSSSFQRHSRRPSLALSPSLPSPVDNKLSPCNTFSPESTVNISDKRIQNGNRIDAGRLLTMSKGGLDHVNYWPSHLHAHRAASRPTIDRVSDELEDHRPSKYSRLPNGKRSSSRQVLPREEFSSLTPLNTALLARDVFAQDAQRCQSQPSPNNLKVDRSHTPQNTRSEQPAPTVNGYAPYFWETTKRDGSLENGVALFAASEEQILSTNNCSSSSLNGPKQLSSELAQRFAHVRDSNSPEALSLEQAMRKGPCSAIQETEQNTCAVQSQISDATIDIQPTSKNSYCKPTVSSGLMKQEDFEHGALTATSSASTGINSRADQNDSNTTISPTVGDKQNDPPTFEQNESEQHAVLMSGDDHRLGLDTQILSQEMVALLDIQSWPTVYGSSQASSSSPDLDRLSTTPGSVEYLGEKRMPAPSKKDETIGEPDKQPSNAQSGVEYSFQSDNDPPHAKRFKISSVSQSDRTLVDKRSPQPQDEVTVVPDESDDTLFVQDEGQDATQNSTFAIAPWLIGINDKKSNFLLDKPFEQPSCEPSESATANVRAKASRLDATPSAAIGARQTLKESQLKQANALSKIPPRVTASSHKLDTDVEIRAAEESWREDLKKVKLEEIALKQARLEKRKERNAASQRRLASNDSIRGRPPCRFDSRTSQGSLLPRANNASKAKSQSKAGRQAINQVAKAAGRKKQDATRSTTSQSVYPEADRLDANELVVIDDFPDDDHDKHNAKGPTTSGNAGSEKKKDGDAVEGEKKGKYGPINMASVSPLDLVLIELHVRCSTWKDIHEQYVAAGGQPMREDSLRQRYYKLVAAMREAVAPGFQLSHRAKGSKSKDGNIDSGDEGEGINTKGYKTTAGKNLTQEQWDKVYESMSFEPSPEPDERLFKSRYREASPMQDKDRVHFIYTVVLKTIPYYSSSFSDADSVIMSTPTSDLSEANNTAREVYMNQTTTTCYEQITMNLTNGMMQFEGSLKEESKRVQVSVVRSLRGYHENVMPVTKEGWVSTLCYRVVEETIKYAQDVDDAHGNAPNDLQKAIADGQVLPTSNNNTVLISYHSHAPDPLFSHRTILTTTTKIPNEVLTTKDMANRAALAPLLPHQAAMTGRRRIDDVEADRRRLIEVCDDLEEKDEMLSVTLVCLEEGIVVRMRVEEVRLRGPRNV